MKLRRPVKYILLNSKGKKRGRPTAALDDAPPRAQEFGFYEIKPL
jgi:hypothetical protein